MKASLARYLAGRMALGLVSVLGAATIVFLLLRVIPGDPVEARMRQSSATGGPEFIAAERARLGLDAPLLTQYGRSIAGLFKGDLGTSLWTERPVGTEIASRLSLSLELALLSSLIALVAALALGTAAAVFQNTPLDYAIRIFAVAGIAAPSFWFGMLITIALLKLFNWLPPISAPSLLQDPLGHLSVLAWPALAIGYRSTAVLTRLVRASMIEVLREDYVRTAAAMGLPPRTVILLHALPNALLPTLAMLGIEFAMLIGGLVTIEMVFNINGIGRLLVAAIEHHDLVLVQGIVVVLACLFVLINLAVDILSAAIDPRVRVN